MSDNQQNHPVTISTTGSAPTVTQSACPACGYCPHCGRSNSPWGTFPYYPYQQPYIWYGTVQGAGISGISSAAYTPVPTVFTTT